MDSICVKEFLNKLKYSVLANKSKSFGYAFTVLWIFFVFWQASGEWGVLDLNAKGDFLAGFFSPLAFLWLVLGYFQQGEELRLNTEALELQIKELNDSVRQQQKMVQIAQKTLNSEYIQNQPKLSLRQNGFSPEKGYGFHVTNHGKTAYNVKLKIDSCFTNELKIISYNGTGDFRAVLDSALFLSGFNVDIYYKNIFEEQIIEKYYCKKENAHVTVAADIKKRED